MIDLITTIIILALVILGCALIDGMALAILYVILYLSLWVGVFGIFVGYDWLKRKSEEKWGI